MMHKLFNDPKQIFSCRLMPFKSKIHKNASYDSCNAMNEKHLIYDANYFDNVTTINCHCLRCESKSTSKGIRSKKIEKNDKA